MAWLKKGQWARGPRLRSITDYDLRLSVSGFLSDAAEIAADELTDYQISPAVALELAGTKQRVRKLTTAAIGAGLLTARDDGNGWDIVQEQGLHMFTRRQVLWKRARDADRKRPELVVPTRFLYGFHCAYCDVSCKVSGEISPDLATLDHLHPGKRAETLEDVVLACLRCNSTRRDSDDFQEPNPPPATVVLTSEQLAYFAKHRKYLLPEQREALDAMKAAGPSRTTRRAS